MFIFSKCYKFYNLLMAAANKGLNVDEILRLTVQSLFKKYDEDRSNFLDKEECKKLILHTLTCFAGYSDQDTEEYKTHWLK